jgi:translation initiation factor IF-1
LRPLSPIVTAKQRGGSFSVDVQLGGAPRTVLAKLSGRLHVHRIRVVSGGLVTVELSPYDLARGRITYRGRRAPQHETSHA